MGPLNPSRVSSVPALSKYLRWGGAVFQAGFPVSNDRLEPEALDGGPSADEWCRALAAIAEQVVLYLIGYVHEKDFPNDGARLGRHHVQSLRVEMRHRGH